MEHLLVAFTVIASLIVVFSLFNEKVTKLPTEIALLLFSLIVGVLLLILKNGGILVLSSDVENTLRHFRLDKILLDVLLCFMLFTGASELKLPHLVQNIKEISLLALLTTVIASALYGLLFWGISELLGIHVGFTLCFLLGSIVSPTDPIAATGILNKMGLTKNVTAVMEGESLFNDGTGVALFIFIKDLYLDTKGSNFFVVMCKELFGALAVGLIVSFVFFYLIKATKDPIKHIIISMLSVALSYVICEECGFSGVIASVVCGIYFSTQMDKYKAENEDLDPLDYYKDFWSIIDALLNYILYVLIGLSFIYVNGVNHMILVALAAILVNLIARYVGVIAATSISRQCPDGYKLQPFTLLMTWSGLKGGLCLALAMSAMDILPAQAYDFILYVTFVTIIFTTVVQGLSVGRVFEFIKKKWPIDPPASSN